MHCEKLVWPETGTGGGWSFWCNW